MTTIKYPKPSRYQHLTERLAKGINLQIMWPLRSPVDYRDWYVRFLDTIDDEFADLEHAEYIKNGNWPDNLTLPLEVTRPADAIEQLSENDFRYLYKCLYGYIKAYI